MIFTLPDIFDKALLIKPYLFFNPIINF